MSVPPPRALRTKRNFKALQLPTGPTLNLAPVAAPNSGFRRPPSPLPPVAQLNPNAPIPSTGDTPVTSQQRSAIRATITQTIAGFPRKSLDLQNEKLIHLREIGQGNGGSVSLVRHRDTDIIMAKKIVLIDAKPSIRKQIVRELSIMHECDSPYIIECYGSYLSDPNICICMEYMDRGSFDSIYKKTGPIHVEVVARVAMSVLEGLTYLYDVHRIIHRDIKPSNILCNTKGEIKLIDFGVSGELINSIANTFVGTSIYMSPERIQGAEYSVKSDIWSLGITLVELATGRFPFSEDDPSDSSNFPKRSGGNTPAATPTSAHHSSQQRLPDLDEENVIIITAATASLDLNPFVTTTAASASALHSPVSNRTVLGPGSAGLNPPSSGVGPGVGARVQPQHTRRKSNGVSLHGGGMTMSIIELMHHIIREPAPKLPMDGGRFSKGAEEFVDACLEKEVDVRKTPGVLLNYKWIQEAKSSTYDIAAWALALD